MYPRNTALSGFFNLGAFNLGTALVSQRGHVKCKYNVDTVIYTVGSELLVSLF